MSLRIAKNIPTTTFGLMGQAVFAFIRTVMNMAIIETSGTWNVAAFGSDGSVLSSVPNKFRVTTVQFSAGNIGWILAIRDNVNPFNSGIFTITAVDPDGMGVTLTAPLSTWVANGTGLVWSMHNTTSTPATSDFFAFQQPAAAIPPWQCKVTVLVNAVSFLMNPNGTYDTSTHAFDSTPLSTTFLNSGTIATSKTFIECDDVTGWLVAWNEDGNLAGSNRNIVSIGNFVPYHFTGVPGFPQDNVGAGVFGCSVAAHTDNCSRNPTTVHSIAADASVFASDKVTPVSAQFATITFADSTTDPLASSSYVTNPRTGQSDDYPAIIIQPSNGVDTSGYQIRGNLYGIRCVNDNINNRTLVSSGNVYVVKNGIAVPWDTTTPV